MGGWLHTEMQTVTHQSTNRAQRTVATLIETRPWYGVVVVHRLSIGLRAKSPQYIA